MLNSSFPEGNFRGNKLLDGSTSLSPLYPNSTIDLHIRIATSFHQCFQWLHLFRHSSPSFRSQQLRSYSNFSESRTGWSMMPQNRLGISLLTSTVWDGLYFYCAHRFRSLGDLHTCLTPGSVFQDGSDGVAWS